MPTEIVPQKTNISANGTERPTNGNTTLPDNVEAVRTSATPEDFERLRLLVQQTHAELGTAVLKFYFISLVFFTSAIYITLLYFFSIINPDLDLTIGGASFAKNRFVFSFGLMLPLTMVFGILFARLSTQIRLARYTLTRLLALARETGEILALNGYISVLQWQMTKIDLSRYEIEYK